MSIGTRNAPFELKVDDARGGLVAWKEIIAAAMFLTTDNATAQANRLLGSDRCIRIKPLLIFVSIDIRMVGHITHR